MSKIQVNEIVNHFDTGAPDCPKGLTVTGFTTFTGGGSFSGSVSIGGTLTYEDVTNIDSVGLSTFQNGIHVTGGSVGVGTNNPGGALHVDSKTTNVPLIVQASQNNRARLVFRNNQETGTECVVELIDEDLRFNTNSGERMRIVKDGNIGIGLTDPSAPLEILHTSNRRHQFSFDDSILTIKGANSSGNPETIRLIGGDSIRFHTGSSGSGSEVVRITTDGEVGIGSDNPDAFLVVQGNSNDSTAPSIRLKDGSDTREVSITNTSGDFVVYTHGIDNNPHGRIKIFENGVIDFDNGGSGGSIANRVRINGSGGMNVGAAVISSASGEGNIVVDEGVYISSFNGDYQIRGNSAGSGSATLYIGNAAINTSSDRRLKENIVDTVVDAAEELKRVRVVDFTWNDSSDTSYNNKNARGTWTGVIAQELVDVFPFAVNAPRKEEDLSIDHESEKTWMLNQDQLVPVLIKGFQQALTRIETLEAEVSELRGN